MGTNNPVYHGHSPGRPYNPEEMCQQFLDTSRYILFAYMLINDTLQLLSSVLLFLFVMGQVKFALVYCVPLLVISTATFLNTPLILATMSVERYVAIFYPLQRPAAWHSDRIWIIILSLWLISCIFPMIEHSMREHNPAVDVFSTPVLCKIINSPIINSSPIQRLFEAAINILFFVVVAVIILFTYVRILLETRNMRQDRVSVSKAMHTVLLHGFQLLLCVLAFTSPITETLIVLHANWLPEDVVFFNFFCFMLIPRFLSPLIYGFRDQSLRGYIRKTSSAAQTNIVLNLVQFLDTSRYILFAYMLINDTLQLLSSVLLFLFVMGQVERYVAIFYPLQRPAAWHSDRIWIIILSLWLISCIFPIIEHSMREHNPAVDVFSTPVLCKIINSPIINSSPIQRLFKAAINILFFVVVAVIILFTYVRILLETRNMRQDRVSVSKAMHTVLLHGFQLLLCVLAFTSPITETLIVLHANWLPEDPHICERKVCIIAAKVSSHIAEYVSGAQKGISKDTRDTKHQLLVDRAVARDCKANLCTDYKEAYDSVPHTWILENCTKSTGL
ncbi:hypothetical protein L3Q82_004919 [Scortum barcoo]|uniref:Uncharacterized protein n=1 Tax=Scortum barcoo TaxID=214431 RepID=A0ACB8VDG7_9TELE|nr:hypothetical protein L3Q82_004919 [Scortum barcoo]